MIRQDSEPYEYEEPLTIERGTSAYEDMAVEETKENAILFTTTHEYETFDEPRIEKFINQAIMELIDDYGMSQSMAYQILQKKNWNLTKAVQYITEDANYETMDIKVDIEDPFDCPICFSTVRLADACRMDCDHCFCKDCFVGFLCDTVKDGESCAIKTCPYSGCKEIITEKIYEKYLPENLKPKYKKFKIKYVVETSTSFMWCPAADCKYVIHLISLNKNEKIVKNIRCDCGNYFCFGCRAEAHRPLNCDLFSKWLELTGGSGEQLNKLWILKNTKKCPKCKVDIEKNNGCMHMTCRSCRYEWCWICLGDWKEHGEKTGGFYACNKFVADTNSNKSDETKQLEKLDFYRNRYDDHKKAMKQAIDKRTLVLKNMEGVITLVKEIDRSELKYPFDERFLKEALDLIVEARRAVTMTYPFAYYMYFTKSNQDLFEWQQATLWMVLDNLDEFTDQCKDADTLFHKLVDEIGDNQYMISNKFIDFRSDIINKTSGVAKAINILLSYIETDLEKDCRKQELLMKANDTNKVQKQKLVQPTKSTKQPQMVMDKSHWYCALCTYANEGDSARCGMCQNVKKVKNG